MDIVEGSWMSRFGACRHYTIAHSISLTPITTICTTTVGLSCNLCFCLHYTLMTGQCKRSISQRGLKSCLDGPRDMCHDLQKGVV
jgi:hypothetical protein